MVGGDRLDVAGLWLSVAIVAAFALDERTVSTWQDKAGQHAKRVQEAIVCQGQVDVGQVQGDEFMSKPSPVASGWRRRCASFSRLLLWGAVSIERNGTLVTVVVEKVKAAASSPTARSCGRRMASMPG
ncbi:MAG: hypothetical protein R3E79_61110 [Caldilineaceae bacterium]